MTEKTIWQCDGCDKERQIRNGDHADWKYANIAMEGFKGYPTNASEDVVKHRFHLCPDCARRYYENANPRRWPRLDKPAPSPVETPS